MDPIPVARVMRRYMELVIAHFHMVVYDYVQDLLQRWDMKKFPSPNTKRATDDVTKWTYLYVLRWMIQQWTREMDDSWKMALDRKIEKQSEVYEQETDQKWLATMLRQLAQESVTSGLYRVLILVCLSEDFHLDTSMIGKHLTYHGKRQHCLGSEKTHSCATVIIPPILDRQKKMKSDTVLILNSQFKLGEPLPGACNPKSPLDDLFATFVMDDTDDEETKDDKTVSNETVQATV